jgi:hypothetical protein
MKNPFKTNLWTICCLAIGLGQASCGGKDDSGGTSNDSDSGKNASDQISTIYDDWNCAENPTDACGQAVCSLLTAAQSLEAIPGFDDAVVCYTDLATCYENACTDPKNIDTKALSVCGTNYYTCMCSVKALQQYMQAQCDALK